MTEKESLEWLKKYADVYKTGVKIKHKFSDKIYVVVVCAGSPDINGKDYYAECYMTPIEDSTDFKTRYPLQVMEELFDLV